MPPSNGTYVVDEEATVRQATESRFKYCNVIADHLCQSPDSQLVFKMPLELEVGAGYPQFTEYFQVYNDGYQELVIGTYEVAIVDDEGRWYPIHYSGPGGYHDKSQVFPALKLQPKEEVDIKFWGAVERGEHRRSQLKAIAVQYRLLGDDKPTTVVVSYQPSNIVDLAPRRIPSERDN